MSMKDTILLTNAFVSDAMGGGMGVRMQQVNQVQSNLISSDFFSKKSEVN